MLRKLLAYVMSFCIALVDFLFGESLFSDLLQGESDRKKKTSSNGETPVPSIEHCPECNHDLTGNTSGVCPECGAEVDESVLNEP